MKTAVLILRSLLGLVFFVFGLNFFFHFIPMSQGAMPPKAGVFMGGLMGAGYFMPFVKVIESLSGLLLIVNKYTALVLVILYPITVNIFLFHSILEPSGIAMGLGLILIHSFLGYAYRKYYTAMFAMSPVVE